uniref:Uncharacterized protein n=1 Tax=Tanacetum cinerariifolium TaxID=118510 RepID=A0A699GRL9_TANCI|nr:hypothetical protein [Tanacetum cinerariifolium]
MFRGHEEPYAHLWEFLSITDTYQVNNTNKDGEVDAAKDAKVNEDDDEAELAELKEVIEVVTTVKLMTKVVTAAATTITDAPSAARRRKGVVIRDPEETATPSTIVHFEPKSKDKGKGILVEEPKPLKKQAQIKQDEAYARELEVELKKNINWDDMIEQEEYDGIFEKYDWFQDGLLQREKSEEKLEEEASRALKRKTESFEQQATKKQKLDEEVEELKNIYKLFPMKKMIFGVDVVEDFKEYTLRDYYCWLKTYCCWYKLKLLDNAADSRLRLLEESDAVVEKIKE